MNPQYYSSGALGTGGLRRLVRLAVIVLLAISVILLILTFTKSKLSFDVPAHSIVYVNGHRTNSKSVSLQAGSYTIRVVSPTYETSEASHHVNLWPTTYKPALKPRSTDAILSSVIGASGLYGNPSISDVKWFGDNTWLVGVVGPGNATPIALHFTNNGWAVGYYPVGSYPQSLSLPDGMATYIGSLENKYAN
jgi:hypothetical protein